MGLEVSSHGLWGASAPPAPDTRVLCGDHTADVAIIGAGFTGCSAALHLAEAGRAPVVLEASDIGHGGSGRNVGLVNAGLWVMPEDVPAALGETLGERLLEQLGAAPALVFELTERHGIACEAMRSGTLHCGVGENGFRELTERAAQWRRRGADVELLDADAAEKLIGSRAYSGALLDRRAGTIQPLAYVRGLADHALRAGARIHTRSQVTGVEKCGADWRVSTATGSITAPWVVIATDAYSQGPVAGVQREQVALPYFNLATDPLPDALRRSILPERQGAWDTRQILSSFRFDAQGRLVFGSVGALRNGGMGVHGGWARRELSRLFPQLEDIAFQHSWYGTIGMTDDALPRLHVHAHKMVSISAYNGRGIAPGTTFGRDLARLVMKDIDLDQLSLPVTDERPASFRALRGAYYEAGSQLAHLFGARF